MLRESLAKGGRACRPRIATPTLAAAFRYWSVPLPRDVAQPAPPLFAVEAEKLKGVLESRVTQELTLTRADSDRHLAWRHRNEAHLASAVVGF